MQAWWNTPLGREHFRWWLRQVLSEDELEDVMGWVNDPFSVPKPVELIRRLQESVKG